MTSFLRDFLIISGGYFWFLVLLNIGKIMYRIVKNAYLEAKAEEK